MNEGYTDIGISAPETIVFAVGVIAAVLAVWKMLHSPSAKQSRYGDQVLDDLSSGMNTKMLDEIANDARLNLD